MEWPARKKLEGLEWPHQIPNVNIYNLKAAVYPPKPTNISQLEKFYKEWRKISKSSCDNLWRNTHELDQKKQVPFDRTTCKRFERCFIHFLSAVHRHDFQNKNTKWFSWVFKNNTNMSEMNVIAPL